MDEQELAEKMAGLLLEYSSDPRNYVDPLFLMFAEIEKKLYWEQEKTPAPSSFVKLITLLDTLEGGIIAWFVDGKWRYDDREFKRLGGPRLRKVNVNGDLMSQLIPAWLMEKLTKIYSKDKIKRD